YVVARHHHLGALGELNLTGDVRRPEIELRTIVGEERRVTATLVLRQDGDFSLEIGVRGDRAGLGQNLAALDVLTAHAAQKRTDVVARLALIEQLAEHLDAGDDGLLGVADADDLDFLADLDDAGLDAAGDDRAAARDREHVLDRHQERLVERTLGLRNPVVDRGHQLKDRFLADFRGLVLERGERRAGDDRNVVAVEVALGKLLADFELDQLQKLRIVDLIDLVQIDDHGRNADLLGKQDVLLSLRHRAVGGGDDEDRAVHLRGAGDHVLHIVGVTRAIDVGVMALFGFILDVRGRNRDAALALLGGLVDVRIVDEFRAARFGQDLGDRRRQRRLAMVDVTDGPDVAVRLIPLEFSFRHFKRLFFWKTGRPARSRTRP